MRSLAAIEARREGLVARADEERSTIAMRSAPFAGMMATGDRVVAALDWLRERPWIVALAAAVVVASGPRRALRWTGRGFALWRSGRWLVSIARDAAARFAPRI